MKHHFPMSLSIVAVSFALLYSQDVCRPECNAGRGKFSRSAERDCFRRPERGYEDGAGGGGVD